MMTYFVWVYDLEKMNNNGKPIKIFFMGRILFDNTTKMLLTNYTREC